MMESNNTKTMPIIDISPLNQYTPWCEGYRDRFYKDPLVQKISDEIAHAFVEWGFLYLVNHGIQEKLISDAFECSKRFFTLDKLNKDSVIRTSDGENWGYVPYNVETFEKTRPFDLKECFNYFPDETKSCVIEKHVKSFSSLNSNLFKESHSLSLVLMRVISMQLPVLDQNFLSDQHLHIGEQKYNPTVTRMLYYPVVNKDDVLDRQLRCGEHSDYGTITLLFQDDAGGLQVVNPAGEYINATPIEGSIVVNCGDMLKIWSSGRFKSTRHRVLVPEDTDKARQSIVFFCHPDNDITVSCLDGSDKYLPQNPYKYLMDKFSDTYS